MAKVMNSPFDESAHEWDTDYRIKRAKLISDEMRKVIQFDEEDSIIDFGAGTGLIGLSFLQDVRDILLIEQSQEMRLVMKNKIQGLESKGRIRVGEDIFDPGLAPVDTIVSSMVLHHNKDLERLGNRFFDLLNPLGKLCIVDLMPDDGSFHENERSFDGYDGFDPDWLKDVFLKAGFVFEHKNVFFSDTKKGKGKQVDYSLFILIMKKGAQ